MHQPDANEHPVGWHSLAPAEYYFWKMAKSYSCDRLAPDGYRVPGEALTAEWGMENCSK
jgi:hypothetical protein